MHSASVSYRTRAFCILDNTSPYSTPTPTPTADDICQSTSKLFFNALSMKKPTLLLQQITLDKVL